MIVGVNFLVGKSQLERMHKRQIPIYMFIRYMNYEYGFTITSEIFYNIFYGRICDCPRVNDMWIPNGIVGTFDPYKKYDFKNIFKNDVREMSFYDFVDFTLETFEGYRLVIEKSKSKENGGNE